MFSELQNILMEFVLGVKKKNAEEYEPSSIRAIIGSIDRYLKRNNYGASIPHDKEFLEVLDILKKSSREMPFLSQNANQSNFSGKDIYY